MILFFTRKFWRNLTNQHKFLIDTFDDDTELLMRRENKINFPFWGNDRFACFKFFVMFPL